MTDDIMKKIDGSQKVAKKLERFAKKANGQSKDDESDSEDEHNDSNDSSFCENSSQSHDTSLRTENTDATAENTDATEKSSQEQLTSLELNTDLFFEKLKELDQKLHTSECCLCNCHKRAQVENATQTGKYLNGYTNGTSSCSTASIQTQTSSETETETNNNSLDVVYEKKPMNGYTNGVSAKHMTITSKSDFSTQTLSTGDIVITKVYFNEGVAN